MATQTVVASAFDTPVQPPIYLPTVLAVGEDQASIAQLASMLVELDYPHQCAPNAREALGLLGHDPAIQIIVADTQMSSMNSFMLIEEARARIGNHKPIAVIMISNHITAELAIKGLHIEAVDLLAKPLGFEGVSTALRRAMRYLTLRRANAEETSLNAQFARLVSALGPVIEPDPHVALSDKAIRATLRAIVNSRSLRNRFFKSRLFADPAWDILLDLTRAKLDGQQVSVSSVCIAASVPMSTALRWVRRMTDDGLLRRWTDPADSRRDLIALTDSTAKQMRDCLSSVHAMIQKV